MFVSVQKVLLKAQFEIEPDLPEYLKDGVFKEKNTFPCWVRFSNQNSPQAADNVKDIRGVAIKLMSVEGEKILPGEKEEKTQDFILISTSYFVTKNIVAFAKLIKSLTSGKLRTYLFFLLHPRITYNLLTTNKRFVSLLEARVWSVAPYLFGNEAVKYTLKPQSPAVTAAPEKPAPNYLTSVMSEQLKNNDYAFDFMVQFQKDTKRMPVENLSKAWNEEESPFIKVATLRIPIQEFDSKPQVDYGEILSFTPWHSLPEHRPIGNINRGRKVVYDTLSSFRHEQNKLPKIEPVDFNIPK